MGLFLTCMNLLGAMFFFIVLHYLTNLQDIKYAEWDLKTVTAADYTVEFRIPRPLFENFCQQRELRGDKQPDESKVFDFSEYLKEKLEEILNERPIVFDEEEIKIANIAFAFDNAQLIHLLRKRGAAIKYNKVEQVEKIQGEINELKTEHLDTFIRPVTAFITFETEEGVLRARAIQEKKEWFWSATTSEVEFDGHPLILKDAAEPTNIIWENRQYTDWERYGRLAFASFVAFLLLSLSFVFIVYIKLQAMENNKKYASVSCPDVDSIYSDPDLYERYALKEWYDYYKSPSESRMTGVLQCFC